MLEPLTDLPDGVIGFTAVGKLQAEDYRDVLVPAITEVLADGRKVRIVLVFPTFEGLSAGGAWEDLKMGVAHLTHWKRIAVVTDVAWMVHAIHLFGWMSPGEVKQFPVDQRAAAIEWAAAG